MADRVTSIATQFRNYDKCVESWVKTIPTNTDGTPTPVVIATPDKAFAAMIRLLKIKGDATGEIPIRSIPLPFVSISPGSISFDPTRYHGPVNLVLGETDDRTQSFRAPHPLPYDISYRVEFWAKNMETLNAFKLWATTGFTFGSEAFITVDLSDVWPAWNKRVIPVVNNGIRFSGELEPEQGHRILRELLEFSLKAWIIPPVQTIKNVHKIIIDTYMAKTQANIATVDYETVAGRPDLYEKVDTEIVE